MAAVHPSFIEGIALRERHQWKLAAAAFERVLVDEPANALASFWCAVSHDNRGDKAAAIPCYRRALAGGLEGEQQAHAWLWLASSLSKTGATVAEAREAFDAAEAEGGYDPQDEYERIRASIGRRSVVDVRNDYRDYDGSRHMPQRRGPLAIAISFVTLKPKCS